MIGSLDRGLELHDIDFNDVGAQPQRVAFRYERAIAQHFADCLGGELEGFTCTFLVAARPDGRDQHLDVRATFGRKREDGK